MKTRKNQARLSSSGGSQKNQPDESRESAEPAIFRLETQIVITQSYIELLSSQISDFYQYSERPDKDRFVTGIMAACGERIQALEAAFQGVYKEMAGGVAS